MPRYSQEMPACSGSFRRSWCHRVETPATASLPLDQILATASPFDDVFDCGDASSWNGTDETARDSAAPQV